ncbi:tRNA epoxyqueuosine(34) reductase QueG [Acinetobacter sp. c1-l78]|uniref:tRNA epoxyqueuosine(34) reductase QueG n=1 Tax=Acinetobacter sp. c1-l78 TaxID=3342803 RepID=UPI0035B8A74B
MTKKIKSIDLELKNNPELLKAWIKQQALDLGFSDCAVAEPDNRAEMAHYQRFLDLGYHADMDYLAENLDKRADPTLLVPGTRSIICVRMDYLQHKPQARYIPDTPDMGIIARYARGRDYHKTMRGRLKQLASRIEEKIGEFISRPFADSAPILERPLAAKAGLGWVGKHTLIINKQAGSFFVLGELFCSLDLPFDTPVKAHCGSCSACIGICPTQAIVEPYLLDARKCIAYLTIEYKGSIDMALRPLIGNRIFGCDDCQLICPWNRYAQLTSIDDFHARHGLDDTDLLSFWAWDESEFLSKTEGSPIRRTGFQSFKRNVAIGLGNAHYSEKIVQALSIKHAQHNDLVYEHQDWALQQQLKKASSKTT